VPLGLDLLLQRDLAVDGLDHQLRWLQIAQEEGEAAPSKLGLVRIAAEGNCKISARTDNGTVTVTAVLQREG
jgi:hypothetical protein